MNGHVVCLHVAPVWNQSNLTRLFCMELEILNIQPEQQQQRDDNLSLADLHSCLLCMQTACKLRICSSWK